MLFLAVLYSYVPGCTQIFHSEQKWQSARSSGWEGYMGTSGQEGHHTVTACPQVLMAWRRGGCYWSWHGPLLGHSPPQVALCGSWFHQEEGPHTQGTLSAVKCVRCSSVGLPLKKGNVSLINLTCDQINHQPY